MEEEDPKGREIGTVLIEGGEEGGGGRGGRRGGGRGCRTTRIVGGSVDNPVRRRK